MEFPAITTAYLGGLVAAIAYLVGGWIGEWIVDYIPRQYGRLTQERIAAQWHATERDTVASLDPEARGDTTLTVNERPTNGGRAERIARMVRRMRNA